MIPMSLAQVAEVTGGRLHGLDDHAAASLVVDGPVVTDSREAGPGGLYIARVGEQLDGHQFVASAAALGAVAAMTTRPVDELPCVVVDDIQDGLASLARAVVDRHPDLTVIGITGSSGKTSTKDLLASVLSSAAPTVAPVGSLNSEVGVPLTVFRVEPQTRFLVVEMGARGVGHIAYLTRIAPPRIGIELNVGSAHVGEFGSREAIAVAKAELVQALPATGLAVLNVDDPAVRAMAAKTDARVQLVGSGAEADVRATETTLDESGRPSFRVTTPDASAQVTLPLHGEHHVGNALAVVAAALECGLDLPDIVAALATATPASRWRMEVTERADGVTVVNDAYNANPDSMRAALKALVAMGGGRGGADTAPSRRTWAVLGSMLELGDDSTAEHDAIGRLAVRLNIGRLVVVGDTARPMASGAQHEGSWGDEAVWVPDADAAYALLTEELRPGDVVLFKSSRDAGLRWLGDRLAGKSGDNSEEGTT
ncbi:MULTISPECIES: UDP-N-acetylmuramoyl-tripeptide--D-alanyl-D-alanine ligase [unclassified Phycicoccus]|uniref:UDP-N-acetylmuramoyl-tripeptide--D-alanyl-D- alanine ligase n=1 Tax=unclassified Phycicoccus TaxID=2637926 RepID=UPI000703804E|nr:MULTISPECIES: UDP-N-acetylmuramoyl-tripeptide--D-alanyl-D-alanine ligase [unclassified Phycicoccus]KRF25296.1 UDP-N-acetylmuramoyl-tripeptide--D-alanyl-D-alanine ligase [Phycicoccus sp. Soil803]KRF29547.1 UDP-N-acetylmuramoyl-tripeptide--D-alanyl-D-alanine ligase [Phycicoccus sp. Soil802]